MFLGDSGNNNDKLLVQYLNQNQTYSTQSLNPNDSHRNDSDQGTVHDETLSANGLVSKSQRNNQNISDTVNHDYRFFDPVKNRSQRSVANSSLSADEFNSHVRDFENSMTDNINEGSFNSNDPQKDSFNLTIIHDLIDIVSKLIPTLQDSQKPTFGGNQHDANPARNVSNAKNFLNNDRYIPRQENAQEPTDISQRSVKKNVLNSQIADKMFIANQILLNARDTMNLMTEVLPESLKSAIDMVGQMVWIFQHIIDALLEIVKDRRYFDNVFKALSRVGPELIAESSAQRNQSVSRLRSNVEAIGNADSLANQRSWYSAYVPRRIENVISAGNKSGDSSIDRSSLASSSEYKAINESEREDARNDNLTANTSTTQSDEQFAEKNNFSSLQINKDVNNAVGEKQSVKDLVLLRRFNQTDEEVKLKELKKANETRYKNERPSTVLRGLFEKRERDESNDTMAQATSSNQSGMSTIATNMEQQERDSGVTRVLFENVTDDARSYLERPILRHNLSSIVNRSIGDQNVRVNNNLSELDNYSAVIGGSEQKENLNKQFTAAKLRDIGNRLIDALRPIVEKKVIKSDDRAINSQDKNFPSFISNSTNMIRKRNLNHRVSTCMFT